LSGAAFPLWCNAWWNPLFTASKPKSKSAPANTPATPQVATATNQLALKCDKRDKNKARPALLRKRDLSMSRRVQWGEQRPAGA